MIFDYIDITIYKTLSLIINTFIIIYCFGLYFYWLVFKYGNILIGENDESYNKSIVDLAVEKTWNHR